MRTLDTERERERERKNEGKLFNRTDGCVQLGSEPCILLPYKCISLYEFFTAELTIIDVCVFDRDLYVHT
jgi:hypothetical protein